jgi:hypothetical protein
MAVLWLTPLVAGLSLRGPGFNPGSVHVGFVVGKVALGQVFLRVLRFFLCQFHSPGAPLKWKSRQNLIIFLMGLHNKHLLRGASTTKKSIYFASR